MSEKEMRGFEDLECYQLGRKVFQEAYRVASLLPSEEKYNLADQLRRASASIVLNIAEGYGRFYYKDRVRFCYNARGSLSETENHLIVARDLKYISPALCQRGRDITAETQRLLNGYIDYLKREQPGKNEPGHDLNVDRFSIDAADET